MTQLQAPVEPALVLRRTYDAPREHVFAAWTQPEIAARFLGPGDVRASEVTMDVRPGGRYRIVMLMPDESTMVARGTYIEVVKPDRLSMTWGWEEDDPSQEHESLLTLEFVAAWRADRADPDARAAGQRRVSRQPRTGLDGHSRPARRHRREAVT